jgi:hypothetical protein
LLSAKNKGFLLATIHRDFNTDDRVKLNEIMSGLKAVDMPVVFPAHPRVKKQMEAYGVMSQIKDNDDFHLINSSPAIDAGYEAPGYEYLPFDLDGRWRKWCGIPGNDAIIDIGVFEYGSPALGEINVFTINSDYESMIIQNKALYLG